MTDIDTGTLLSGLGAFFLTAGSVVLAIRVKKILEWVLTLIAHEVGIEQLLKAVNGEEQDKAIPKGTVVHLINTVDGIGVVLLICGFFLTGVGGMLNAISKFM